MIQDNPHLADLAISTLLFVFFGAFTGNVQRTTMELGRRLSTSPETALVMQSVVTPKWQTRNMLIVFAIGLLHLFTCFQAFNWYLAIPFFLVTVFIGVPLAGLLLPRPMSSFIVTRVRRALAQRHDDYSANGDSEREQACKEVLDLLDANSCVSESAGAEVLIAESERASAWVPWYFRRGFLTIFTAPLFILLAACFVIALFGALVQAVALYRVLDAVLGWFAASFVCFFAWVLIALPPILYFSLLKNLPGLWMRRDATTRSRVFASLAVLVLLPAIASLVYQSVALGIGWIADQDPCAAFEAGVTGSIPPANCGP